MPLPHAFGGQPTLCFLLAGGECQASSLIRLELQAAILASSSAAFSLALSASERFSSAICNSPQWKLSLIAAV